ncbi:MAG: isoamylase early set domain-containing protein [Anaerolineae bacterium]
MLKRKGFRDSDKVKVTFVLPDDAPRASVVGDFNDWDPNANPLIRRSNHTYSTSVILEPGKRYAFRYRTLDGEWFNEEGADAQEPNEFGEVNSIIIT